MQSFWGLHVEGRPGKPPQRPPQAVLEAWEGLGCSLPIVFSQGAYAFEAREASASAGGAALNTYMYCACYAVIVSEEWFLEKKHQWAHGPRGYKSGALIGMRGVGRFASGKWAL